MGHLILRVADMKHHILSSFCWVIIHLCRDCEHLGTRWKSEWSELWLSGATVTGDWCWWSVRVMERVVDAWEMVRWWCRSFVRCSKWGVYAVDGRIVTCFGGLFLAQTEPLFSRAPIIYFLFNLLLFSFFFRKRNRCEHDAANGVASVRSPRSNVCYFTEK